MSRKLKHQLRNAGWDEKVVTPPADVAASIDRITSDDRRWFLDHPSEETRVRPAAPDEFWPVFDSASVRYVVVAQVRPGFRLRAPVVAMVHPESERVQ